MTASAAFALQKAHYALLTIAITAAVVLLLTLAHVGDVTTNAEHRLFATVLGGAMALVVARIAPHLPRSSRPAMDQVGEPAGRALRLVRCWQAPELKPRSSRNPSLDRRFRDRTPSGAGSGERTMGVSISLANGSNVIVDETPQGGAVTWLPNGDQVVSSETSSGNSNYQVHVQLYSPQGAPIGPAFSETAPPVSLFTAPVVAGLADGSYEAAWVQQGNYASHLLAEHFTAQGTAAGQATLATTSGFSVIGSSGYAVAGLADGGFAAAWTVQDTLNSGSPAQVWAEAFTASGAPVGSATLLGPPLRRTRRR